jgi:type IV pilus assembly protein PilC
MSDDTLDPTPTTTRPDRADRVRQTPAAGRRQRGTTRPGSSGPGRARSSATWSRAILPVGRVRGGGVGARASRERWRPTRDHLDLIASLLEAGISLEDAFSAFARTSAGSPNARAATTVSDAVRRGVGLADALEAVAAPTHVVALARGSERTGRTPEALRAAGDLTGRLDELRRGMRRAALYPAVVLLVGLAMVVLISIAVVPQLERTFLDLGGDLPAPTRMVLDVSAALRSVWTPVIAVGLIALRRPIERASRRLPVARIAARIPVVGALRRDLAVAVLARLVATMLAAGVGLVDVLRSSATALDDDAIRERAMRAADEVARGGSAFTDDGLRPVLDPVELEILAVGERTGLLAEQWRRVAERRSDALSERVTRLGAVMEPLLVVVVGGLVGGAVIALYLPTFRVLDLL